MGFITLGTSTELQIKVPTIGTTDWADTMRTDTFLKIAEHLHTGSGDGAQLGTGSLLADAVTGAKIRLDNDEYLRARNAADSANVNLLKLDSNDDLYLDPDLSKLNMKNNTSFSGRNNADGADISLLKVNTSDKLELEAEIGAVVKVGNNLALQHRNQADAAYIDTIKVNTSDKIELGADLADMNVINNVYTSVRNNADSGYVDVYKVDASDQIQMNVHTLDAQGSVALSDNQAETTTGIITLASNESAILKYKILRGTDVQSGELEIEQSNASVVDSYNGDDTGVTFTLASDVLSYATTSTGNAATLTYTLIKN